jgi:Ca-activated chloride channel homolog
VDMPFIWPGMLLWLLAMPLLVLLYVRTQRQRTATRAHSFGALGQSMPQTAGRRRHIPPLFFLLALATLLVALARPEAVVSLPRIEGTVILAFDVSGSMAADDLEPTRMEAAKAAARAFVEGQPASVRVGVVAFSDNGFSVQVPTNDAAEVVAAINRLVPQRGTSLAYGILTSLNTLAADGEETRYYTNLTPTPTPTPTPLPEGTYAPAAIILLSDGENNESPDPLEAAKTAAELGVRIYTVGIGSVAGSILEIEGFTIHSQLNEAMLEQIADITDAAYFSAASAEELETIYDNLNPQLLIRPVKSELTSLFAGAGILLLLLGAVFSLAWFGRVP